MSKMSWCQVKLGTEVDLDIYSPACLPRPLQEFAGQHGWVYGEWDSLLIFILSNHALSTMLLQNFKYTSTSQPFC